MTTLEDKFGTEHAKRCLQTERSFLAACIFDPKEALKVSDRLGDEHFTNPGHWGLVSRIMEAESRGTNLTVADLGQLAVRADIDINEFDIWNLLDEQWETRGDMLPMLAETLIDLAAQEDQVRYHIRSIGEIIGNYKDLLIESQLPKQPTGLKMSSRVRHAWRRKHHVRVAV